MRRWFLPVALIIAAVGLIVALIRGVARDILVIPLLNLFWQIGQAIESLPQAIVWALIVLIGVVLGLRSMVDPPRFERMARGEAERGNRVAFWARLLSLAARDDYSRWRMAQRLALLATEAIALRQGCDLRQARRIVESGADFPPTVRAYLRAGLGPQPQVRGVFDLLKPKRSNDPLALPPAEVIAAIETLTQS
ncbi:MAG: hypothetical protein Fur005_29510 [Roseiflexaceae bacterium]